MKSEFFPTISQFMRQGNRFTDRDFMRALGLGHPKLKACEADPALFSMRELGLLAAMFQVPLANVLKMVLGQLGPEFETQCLAAVVEPVVGRKRQPRKIDKFKGS